MAFHGEFVSFPLPEILQWLDSSRKTGTLQMSWDAAERKLFLLSGEVVATASEGLWERVGRTLSLAKIAKGESILAAFADMRRTGEVQASFRARNVEPSMPVELARDELFGAVVDLIRAQGGTFHWTEDADRGGDEWVPMELSLRQLLFEALRRVDEQPEVDSTLPRDTMTVRALAAPTPDLPLMARIILALTQAPLSVGKLRLAMGASRSLTVRRVFDLMRSKMVDVEGAPDLEADPIAQMLEKGSVLVRERQFEAAGLVFASLLAQDPADRRVREFARMVDREHVAALYAELPPIFIPELADDPESMALLRPEERHVASLVNSSWDVATIVLASQARELDTLKALAKLNRMGLIRSSAANRAGATRVRQDPSSD